MSNLKSPEVILSEIKAVRVGKKFRFIGTAQYDGRQIVARNSATEYKFLHQWNFAGCGWHGPCIFWAFSSKQSEPSDHKLAKYLGALPISYGKAVAA